MDMRMWRPLLQRNKNALPLAQSLIAAAAEQGASRNELKIACDLAQMLIGRAMDNSSIPVSAFKDEAEATLQCIEKEL